MGLGTKIEGGIIGRVIKNVALLGFWTNHKSLTGGTHS